MYLKETLQVEISNDCDENVWGLAILYWIPSVEVNINQLCAIPMIQVEFVSVSSKPC
jgi:hypothetical protein